MTHWTLVSQRSIVRIDGSSSLHPIRASATGPTGWLEIGVDDSGFVVGATAGHLEVEVARLSSGNPLVDRETRRRIDVKRHPLITGDVLRGEVIAPDALRLAGEIGFRGERADVEGVLHLIERWADGFALEGSAVFDVRRWGLRVPRLGLLKVHPDIEVSVHLEFADSS